MNILKKPYFALKLPFDLHGIDIVKEYFKRLGMLVTFCAILSSIAWLFILCLESTPIISFLLTLLIITLCIYNLKYYEKQKREIDIIEKLSNKTDSGYNYHESLIEVLQDKVNDSLSSILIKDKKTNFSTDYFVDLMKKSLETGDFKTIRNFSDSYIKELEPNMRNNIISIANMYLKYYTKEYDEALYYMNHIIVDTRLLKYEIRNLQLLIYYETNNFDTLYNSINSYRSMIRRDKLSGDLEKRKLLNFIKYIEAFVKLKTGNKFFDKSQFLSNFAKEETEYKNWIISQIRIIEGIGSRGTG